MTELPPRDAAVALRSFPRRFREAIERAEAAEPGSGDAVLPFVRQALEAIDPTASGADPLAALEAAATALADEVDHVSAAAWARDEKRLGTLRETVRAASAALRAAEERSD